MVFFEAPHRLLQTLDAMQEVFGQNRQAVVCRELTKTYQEVKRATLGELKIWAEGEVLGEITLVVAGADPKPILDLTDPKVRQMIGQLVKEHELATTDRKAAISQIAVQLKLPKREVYDIVVRDGKD
jgi:16S rRNA (cytidine1402-2'-O)-methyltransferase